MVNSCFEVPFVTRLCILHWMLALISTYNDKTSSTLKCKYVWNQNLHVALFLRQFDFIALWLMRTKQTWNGSRLFFSYYWLAAFCLYTIVELEILAGLVFNALQFHFLLLLFTQTFFQQVHIEHYCLLIPLVFMQSILGSSFSRSSSIFDMAVTWWLKVSKNFDMNAKYHESLIISGRKTKLLFVLVSLQIFIQAHHRQIFIQAHHRNCIFPRRTLPVPESDIQVIAVGYCCNIGRRMDMDLDVQERNRQLLLFSFLHSYT